MDKYIAELLENNNRVIIPDFGAFIVKQGDVKGITFNEFLKFNDGLLINYVTERENIDKNEARKKVDEFVGDINTQLSQGIQRKIANIGYLYLDNHKKIQFREFSTSDQNTIEDSDNDTIQKIDDEVLTGESLLELRTDSQEEDDENTGTHVEIAPENIKIQPTKEKEDAKPEEVTITQVIEQKDEPAKNEDILPPKDIEQKRQEAYRQWQEAKQKKSNKNTDKKRNRPVLWIIIFVFVIGAGFLIWYLLNDNETRQTGTLMNEPVVMDTIDTVKAGPAVPPVEQVPVAGKVNMTDKYFVVAGCFQYENNADKYIDILKKNGIYAHKSGKISGLYAVSFSSHNNFREAITEMKKVRKTTEPKAWVHVR